MSGVLGVRKRYRNGIVKEHGTEYGAGRPEFVFDVEKSASNRLKHGIDFVEAQELWDDPALRVWPARSDVKVRQIAVGRIDGKSWAAIFTMRGRMVRLISVRRARQQEVEAHESE